MKKPFVPKKLPLEINSDDLVKLYRKCTNARVRLERFNYMLENSPVQETAIMFFSLNESVESKNRRNSSYIWWRIRIRNYRAN